MLPVFEQLEDRVCMDTKLFIVAGSGVNPRLFKHEIQHQLPNDEVLVVHVKVGAIRQLVRDWEAPDAVRSPAKTGQAYDKMVSRVEKATTGKDVDAITFVLNQGEQDAKRGWSSTYGDSLGKLFESLYDDIGYPVIMESVISLIHSGPTAHYATIRAIQQEFAETEPNLWSWVDTDTVHGKRGVTQLLASAAVAVTA